jgi:hypothetical protein
VAGGPSRSILCTKGVKELRSAGGEAFRDLSEVIAQPGAAADARGSPRPYRRSWRARLTLCR